MYEKSHEEQRGFIEVLTRSEIFLTRGIGHYLKACGLKYGVLGYERNRGMAIEYIKKHNVSY